MPFNLSSPRPADHRIVGLAAYDNIFYAGETITFPLTGTAGSTWEVQNYAGAIVASGSMNGVTTSLTLPALGLGWYKLYFIRAAAAAAPWYMSGGENMFAVVRPGGPLKARPAAGSEQNKGDPYGNGLDLPARGLCGVGPARHQVRLDSGTWAADLAKVEQDIAYEIACRNADAARPLRQFIGFSDGGDFATYPSRLTTSVQRGVAAGVTWFEGDNEPNVANSAAASYAPRMSAFSDAMHAASASAKVMGPCPLSVVGDPFQDGATLKWVREILTTCGSSRFDGISFHNYDSATGDLPITRQILDNFVAMLTSIGMGSKPRFLTEFGSTFAATYGSWEHRWQAKNIMQGLHLLEQYGIPKEQTYLFYDRSHGFWDFPSFWLPGESGNDTQPTPTAPLMRVWGEELFGKPYAAKLDFGSENDVWLGCRFTGSDGSSLLTLQSSGNVGTVKVAVSGVASVVTVDPWGNATTRPVVGGVVSVPVDELPSYVRLPSGASGAPVAVDWGVDATRTKGATATASTNSNTASNAISGTLADNDWEGTALPAWWRVDYDTVRRFNRVVVTCPNPHNRVCTLTDFDVQILDGASWVNVATYTADTTQRVWTSHTSAGAGYVDSFWDRRNQWTFRLASPVSTTALRIYIRSCSYGGGATPETYNQNPNVGLGTEIGQAGPQLPRIREVQVYLNEYDQGRTGAPHLP